MTYKTEELIQRRFELELSETTVRKTSFELSSGIGSNDGERPVLTRHAIEQHDHDVKCVAMEDIDIPVREGVLSVLRPDVSQRESIVSSCQAAPGDMVTLLRGLDTLVTTRYHACVLSMGGGVPQMAISHDERRVSISAELELDPELLLPDESSDLANLTIQGFDYLIEHRVELTERICRKNGTRFEPLCHKNLTDLHDWGLRNVDKVNLA